MVPPRTHHHQFQPRQLMRHFKVIKHLLKWRWGEGGQQVGGLGKALAACQFPWQVIISK